MNERGVVANSCVGLVLVLVVLWLVPGSSRQEPVVRVAAGDDLQKVIDAAASGDTILLTPGVEFVGNFVLPAHGGTSFITIRTDAQGLPGPGERTGPEHAGTLAALRSPDHRPALRTASRAHHWRLENIEFRANRAGAGDIIVLGDSAQRDRRAVPHDLVLDRLYIHGDPLAGQKRGVALNSASTQIVNSYIADIKGVGMDTQAIAGWNGPGPFLIENNYLEAAGENILFGGADPSIDQLVPQGITVRRNHIARPLAWRDPILAAPERVRATARAGGTLASGAYVYRVTAERPVSGDRAVSLASSTAEVTLATPGGSVDVAWAPVSGAEGYRVFRAGPDGTSTWSTTSTTFTDSGARGREGTPPRRASMWTVKNLFELKNARDVHVDGNLFEHHWSQAQAGWAIVFTPRNQDGRAPWSQVENVRFTNNVVRHVASAISISGTDDERPSARTSSIVIANNLFVDVDGGAWGGRGDFVQIGNGPIGIRVENNTVLHTGPMLMVYGRASLGRQVRGLVFRNNVLRHNRYGVFGDGSSTGADTFASYLDGAVFENNVVAGGDRARYPSGNHFISVQEFDSQFADPDAGDYRLKSGSRFPEAGADHDAIAAAMAGSTNAAVVQDPRPARTD